MFNRRQLFRRIAIVGVGMMGASIAMAVKKRGLAKEIVGIGRNEASLKQAKDMGALDEVTTDLLKGIIGADLIILATPVNAIIETLDIFARDHKRGCIVTDIGSSKAAIVDTAEKHLHHSVLFVGSHPLVGSEKHGPANADPNLFEGGICLMTPTDKTNRLARDKVKQFWTMLGSTVKFVQPSPHDESLAFVSHLPHLLAYSMVKAVPDAYMEHAAQGFKDTTRVAASDEKMWADIALSNGKQVLKAMDETIKVLSNIRKGIVANERDALVEIFKQARIKRERLDKSHA